MVGFRPHRRITFHHTLAVNQIYICNAKSIKISEGINLTVQDKIAVQRLKELVLRISQ